MRRRIPDGWTAIEDASNPSPRYWWLWGTLVVVAAWLGLIAAVSAFAALVA